jgi:hypothetical protein
MAGQEGGEQLKVVPGDVGQARHEAASARVLDSLTPGFIAGDFHAAPIDACFGLAQAQEAYRKVAAGAAGRVVLRPQE